MSDGVLAVAELVDLHGRSGFDVLCVTDHVVRSDDPRRYEEGIRFSSVDEATFPLLSLRDRARGSPARGART